MRHRTNKLVRRIVEQELAQILKHNDKAPIKEEYDGGTKDSRGIVKALQDWVNRYSPQKEATVVVAKAQWNGKPNYMIGVGMGWTPYLLDGTQNSAYKLIQPHELSQGQQLFTTSLSKLKQWLQGQPNKDISSAIPPAPPLRGMKTMQQENANNSIDDLTQGLQSAYRLRVSNDVYFYVVTKAADKSRLADIVFKIDPLGFANQLRGGLEIANIVLITTDQQKAMEAANKQLNRSSLGVSQQYQQNRQFVRQEAAKSTK